MAATGYSYNLWSLEQLKTAIVNAYGQAGIADAQCLQLTQALQGLSPEATYQVAASLDNYNLVQNSLNELYPTPVGAYSDIAHGISVNSSVLTSSEAAASEVAASLNSNTLAASAQTAAVQVPVNFAESQGVYTASAGAKVAQGAAAGTTVPTWLGHVACGVVGAGIGLKLGVWIDGVLYNANPDFWDSHNMSELNPDTWNESVIGSGLLKMANYPQVPVMMDANGQMYANQNYFAYVAQYLAGQGAFGGGQQTDPSEIDSGKFYNTYEFTGSFQTSSNMMTSDGYPNENIWTITTQSDDVIGMFYSLPGEMSTKVIYASEQPFTGIYYLTNGTELPMTPTQYTAKDGSTLYIYNIGYDISTVYNPPVNVINCTDFIGATETIIDMGYALVYGTTTGQSELEGVVPYDTTPEGITPTMTLADVLSLLRQQYPDLFDNSIKQGVLQPDGSIVDQTYLPIGWPEGGTTPQPTSVPDNAGAVDPKNEDQTKRLPEILTPTDDTGGGPGDGGDTGTGTPPGYVPPSGSADALYKIYNPTLAQVHSLGAWLWSPNFVDQILKMFSNPMEAIISLHKIYGTPHTASSPQNIKVGYLDSGVSSKVVDEQYITIDCGSVSMKEHYSNIFDYSPYTEVSLYLPFLGIVNLDVADVMRGSVKVVYHIDVITGAVLVEVQVTRDNGAGGVIYQYTGSCAEHYPLSAGSYMGIVTGAAGIAAGVAGTVLSGGALAPMLLGGAASIGSMHTHVQKSGGFSANAGAMGIKTPYFIISRPQSAMSKMWQKYGGMGANTYCTLGACSGFTRVKFIHLDDINGATRADLDAIELAVKEGVIV